MDVEKKHKDRFLFLHQLYEKTNGDIHERQNMYELGSELGFNQNETKLAYQYLKGEGLVEIHGMPAKIGITHLGVRTIEDALSKPDEPTDYFPPVNIISIGTMSHSVIQQASPGALQEVKYGESEIQAIRAVVEEFRGNLRELGLTDKQQQQAQADASTIEAQLASPNPRHSIINDCLSALKGLLLAAATSATSTVIIDKITALLGG